jgi:alpha-amylase
VAGIHAGSKIDFQENAKYSSIYAARVTGRSGELYVRIGGSDRQWEPSASGYSDYREYAQGAGWKVWIKLPGNPPVQQAPASVAFSIPQYRPAAQIVPPPE